MRQIEAERMTRLMGRQRADLPMTEEDWRFLKRYMPPNNYEGERLRWGRRMAFLEGA